MVLLQTLVAGVTMGFVYVRVAMGFNLISNTIRIVNFSQGNIVAFGGLIYITSSVTARLHLLLSLIITVLVSAILGLVLQSLIIHPMVKRRISMGGIIISTIAFASFLSNLA